MGIAFIQDKLEIKFLILYIVSRLTEPVDGADLQDMTMCDEGIDYFDYAECLGDLVKTEHLRVTEDGQYVITEKGRRNSGICESSLPYSVRQLSDRHIAAWNKAAVRRQQVQGRVTPRENGTFTVELRLRDDVDSLMTLDLMVADKADAEALAGAVPEGAGEGIHADRCGASRRIRKKKPPRPGRLFARGVSSVQNYKVLDHTLKRISA